MSALEVYLSGRPGGLPPKIIARSFWGFDPGWASLIGFTHEANRTWFMDNYQDGDLALIYGADGEHASPANIGKILGFIQIEKSPIRNVERMTPDAMRWIEENNLTGRWTHALPMKKAWRCVDSKYELRQLAAHTFSTTEGRIRGSRGVLLTDEEAIQVLKLKVRPVNVFMEPRVYEDEEPAAAPLFLFFSPSQALPPTGPTTVEDGPRCVYLSKLKGPPGLLLTGYPPSMLFNKCLVKVGLSKDHLDRMRSLNQGFPEASHQFGFKWESGLESPQKYPDYEAAEVVERAIKDAFVRAPDDVARSVGGEFFLVDWLRAESLFCSLTTHRDQVVAASNARPNA